jgi:hypothetical protein
MVDSACAGPAPRKEKRVSRKDRWNDFFIVNSGSSQKPSLFDMYYEINVVNHQSKCFPVIRLIRTLIFFSVRARWHFSMQGRGSTSTRFYFRWNQKDQSHDRAPLFVCC